MEFDPETNTYTSHGPRARQRDAEGDIKKMKRQISDLQSLVADLESRIDDLESQLGN